MIPSLWWLASSGIATAATCPLGDPGAAFRVMPQTPNVIVVVEVWPVGAPEGWADAVLDALDRHTVSAVVILPIGADPAPFQGVLTRVANSGHTLGVQIPEALVPSGLGDLGALRKALKPWEQAGEPVKTAVTRVGSASIESTLQKAGLRSLLDASGAAADRPRIAAHLDGQMAMGMILPPGPWSEDAPSRCAPFVPPVADQLARTLERSSGSQGVAVVRWALAGRGGDLGDAAVLDRWLTEVGSRSGARFGSADDARGAVFLEMRGRPEHTGGERAAHSVSGESVTQAAAALRDLPVLPSELPGGLNLTEAFLGLAMRLLGNDESTLHVPEVQGPAQLAGPSAPGSDVVDRAALEGWVRSLLADPPPELPSAARIGSTVYPAREVLLALASAVRGDEPIRTNPTTDPQPNARGLGWGAVGVE